MCFFELIKTLVNCRDVATAAGRDGKVGLIAVHDLEQGVLQGGLYMAIDCEFPYWEKCRSIILPLSGEEPEILFNFLIHPLGLSVRLRVVYSCQLSINSKFLVQCFDEPGHELQSSVANNTPWEPVESEHVTYM